LINKVLLSSCYCFVGFFNSFFISLLQSSLWFCDFLYYCVCVADSLLIIFDVSITYFCFVVTTRLTKHIFWLYQVMLNWEQLNIDYSDKDLGLSQLGGYCEWKCFLSSLLMNRNVTEFCIWILYPASLLKQILSSTSMS
jgi:hypothetical protein